MDVTVTLDQATAWLVADLLRAELSATKHRSHLHLACDDDADARDSLAALVTQLDN